MIFERSLQRELAYTAGAVFLVLATALLASMMIRIVGLAASGDIDPRDMLMMIGLVMTGYCAVMLTVTLFVSVLVVLTRWFRDSEMVVWMSAGVSLADFIRPILLFCAPLIVLIAFFSFVGWPWSHQKTMQLRERFAQRDEIALISPGQFRESPSNHHVFFIESLSANATHVRNVFVANTQQQKVSVVVSSQGQIETQPDGERFVILESGRRYDGSPGQPDYRIMEFERYGLRIENPQRATAPLTTSLSTLDLIKNPTVINLAELAWRAGLPLAALNLILLAIPLAYQNPYRGRVLNLIMAVLIYLTYSNMLNVMQAWIEQKKLSFGIGVWVLHAAVAVGTAIFFILRTQHQRFSTLLKSYFLGGRATLNNPSKEH